MGSGRRRQRIASGDTSWNKSPIVTNSKPSAREKSEPNRSAANAAINSGLPSNESNPTFDHRRGAKDKILGTSFSKREKGRCQSENHHQPKGIEQMQSGDSTQIRDMAGRHTDVPRCPVAMGDHIRPQVVVPSSSHKRKNKQMDEVQGRGPSLPDNSNAFWMGTVTVVEQQTQQTNEGMANSTRDTFCVVDRRRVSFGEHQGRGGTPCIPHDRTVHEIGIETECEEINARRSAVIHLPGPPIQPSGEHDRAITCKNALHP